MDDKLTGTLNYLVDICTDRAKGNTAEAMYVARNGGDHIYHLKLVESYMECVLLLTRIANGDETTLKMDEYRAARILINILDRNRTDIRNSISADLSLAKQVDDLDCAYRMAEMQILLVSMFG